MTASLHDLVNKEQRGATICRVAALQVARQTREVLELLQAAQGFRQVTNAQRDIAARKVVNQVLHSLQRLGDAFGSVLAAEDAARSAGQVLQAVLQSVIGESCALERCASMQASTLSLASVVVKRCTSSSSGNGSPLCARETCESEQVCIAFADCWLQGSAISCICKRLPGRGKGTAGQMSVGSDHGGCHARLGHGVQNAHAA